MVAPQDIAMTKAPIDAVAFGQSFGKSQGLYADKYL
jgi:hypothetical protein